ncbi:MAG: 4Fe-4S binding protein [Dehalococcoidales bacterium]|nr:4Fe-4S binding protein [Dehalococcoidales bacterium]
MPGKMAMVDFNKCNPASCANGVCAAAQACPRKLLVQENPREPPMTNPALCRACGDCVRACPHNAISIMQF